ncbi:shisa-5-like protein [Labeo rohita]|uniref:Shisa-5-like protein n=1 Tax=Labeo rohita TaxID=84645 RepID=A0A498NEN0_LABRO|nr:shisa-5-like protein [Labeo rohita]
MEDFSVVIVVFLVMSFTVIIIFWLCKCARKLQQTMLSRTPTQSHPQGTGQFLAPFSQAAYDGGQNMYPLQPLVQPALPTDYTSPQPPYNPAYMVSPKTR